MLLKCMVESSLLFEDETLTPNIAKIIGFECLEGGLKIRKSAKIGLPNFSF